MAIEQSYINSILIEIKSSLSIIGNRYIVNALNGIYNKSILKDFIKLNSLKRELEELDLTDTDLYTDEYIYNLERETQQYCTKLKQTTVGDVCLDEEFGGSGSVPSATSTIQRRYYFTPSASSGNNSSTGILVPVLPSQLVIVTILTGLSLAVGDGVKTRECYFTDDAGITAKFLNEIAVGDELFYNGNIMGVELDGTETIELLII